MCPMCVVTPDARTSLPATVEAPQQARAFVSEVVCPEHGALAEDAARLLVSELVTHAAVYGAPPLSLQIGCGVHELRLEVRHGGSSVLEPADPDGQLRLLLIDKIARDHGESPDPEGTVLWCTVSTGALPESPEGPTPVRSSGGPRAGKDDEGPHL